MDFFPDLIRSDSLESNKQPIVQTAKYNSQRNIGTFKFSTEEINSIVS